MPTSITSSGITFDDATTQTTSATAAGAIGTTQIAANAVTAAKLGTNEQKQIAKAWVNFNGTTASPSTIRSSYNVSSVTKNGTGDYTINFSTAMADANYSAVVSSYTAGTAVTSTQVYSHSTTSVRILVYNGSGAAVEANPCSVSIFGN